MNVEISSEDVQRFLGDLYSALDTGYEFEEFLRVLLSRMGLEEVQVTSRSRDGGIDVTAIRRGVEGLSNVDEVKYVVQAKRFAPGTTVPIRDVRALRGVLTDGAVGLFITTGKFGREAEEFAAQDPLRPVLLLDGADVIALCVQHELGFVPRPQFSQEAMRALLGSPRAPRSGPAPSADVLRVEKIVSTNDVRARILPIPGAIYELLPNGAEELEIRFDGEASAERFRINHRRRYVAGVVGIFRKAGLMSAAGEFASKRARWEFSTNSRSARVRFADL